MRIEERCYGIELTPEADETIRTAFTNALDRVEERVARLRIRIMRAGDLVRCSARLWPEVGPTLVVTETRASMPEAAYASADSLARALVRRTTRLHRHRGPSRAGSIWSAGH